MHDKALLSRKSKMQVYDIHKTSNWRYYIYINMCFYPTFNLRCFTVFFSILKGLFHWCVLTGTWYIMCYPILI